MQTRAHWAISSALPRRPRRGYFGIWISAALVVASVLFGNLTYDAHSQGLSPNSHLVDDNFGQGYRQVGSDGSIFDYGTANYYGVTSGSTIVGMADTPDNGGY